MTLICPPCREAADIEQAILLRRLPAAPLGHDPATCRDHAIQPGGCPCQHQPPGTATQEARAIAEGATP
ncbi:MAG TPA: hypothetical protein VE465_02215 [Streptosporangiaceae bacterium]|nr:hypothetical protein [Streptosporangiaceae bacterium]